MADPDQGQELQHQPVGRLRSCALALVAADAGPLPAKGVGSREAQPAHELRQEIFEEDDHIATESRAAWDLYVYFTLSNYPVRRCHSSFRVFLLWPDLEVSAPQGGGGELSDYEKLRVARMEANTEFLRGLGLA